MGPLDRAFLSNFENVFIFGGYIGLTALILL